MLSSGLVKEKPDSGGGRRPERTDPCLWAPFALSDIKTGLRNQLVRQYSLDVHLAVEEGVTASISQP